MFLSSLSVFVTDFTFKHSKNVPAADDLHKAENKLLIVTSNTTHAHLTQHCGLRNYSKNNVSVAIIIIICITTITNHIIMVIITIIKVSLVPVFS